MPQKTGPNLGMNYGWDLGESGWNTGMDSNLRKLDAVVNSAVLNIVNTPAVTTDGTRYLVGTSPSGDFAGHADQLAVRQEGAWVFYTPAAGWVTYNLANGKTYRYNGGVWAVPATVLTAQPFLEASVPGSWTFDNTAWTKIPLTTVNTDTADGWDASGNTDYVIPQAGLYLVQGVIRPARSGVNAIPDETAFAAGIGITAQDGDDVSWAVSPAVAAAQFSVNVESVRRYALGDRVSLFAKHSSATAVGLNRARLRILRLTD